MTEQKAAPPGATEQAALRPSANLKTRTLKDLGPNLPHGIVGPDGKLICGFESRPWRGREEREIAKLRSKGRGSPADFPVEFMALMSTQIAQYDFEKKSDVEKALLIKQMYSGDFLYMYIYLRYKCIGHKVRLDVSCEHCGRGFPFVANLETLEVKCAEKPDDVDWVYELSDPFTLRGEKATALDMVPINFATMENTIRRDAKEGPENASAKMDVLTGSIFGRHGGDKTKRSMLRTEDLDEMSKRDIEQLTARIDANGLGPDMRVTGTCPTCARTWVHVLEWAYDSFFGPSSQPLPGSPS